MYGVTDAHCESLVQYYVIWHSMQILDHIIMTYNCTTKTKKDRQNKLRNV